MTRNANQAATNVWMTVIERIAYTRGLTPTERTLLLALALKGNLMTGERCSLTQDALADYAGLSRPHVSLTLGRMVRDGWLSVSHPGRPTVYTINLDKLTGAES